MQGEHESHRRSSGPDRFVGGLKHLRGEGKAKSPHGCRVVRRVPAEDAKARGWEAEQ